MYQILCDDYVLHDVSIDELKVIGGKCSLEINKTGLLKFQIPPMHPHYDKIKKHTSQIKLYQDDKRLFCGRVLNDEADFNNIKYVECEGELSYFLDSIQRGRVHHLDGVTDNVIKTYLQSVVAIHNSQVDDSKKFTVGTVTVNDPNNSIYEISNYEDTLTIIVDKLLNKHGGYLFVRHSNGVRYLDYVSELTNVCNQTIEFGKNIIDMTRYIKGEDIYTALIPLGAKKETTGTEDEETYEKRFTISDEPNSTDGTIKKVNDYIYDTEAVKQWGWIWKVQKWDDVTDTTTLLTKAKDDLKNSINATLTIELTAVDLHLLDVDIDRINVGDRIRCISIPNNLNTTLIVKSIEIDIDNPENTKIKLVSPTGQIKPDDTITANNKDNEKNVTKIKNEINEDYPTYKNVDTKINDLKDWTNTKFNDADSAIKDWTNKQLSSNNNALKNWVSDNFYPTTGGEIDLSAYAKIADVNNAFSELATALGGL